MGAIDTQNKAVGAGAAAVAAVAAAVAAAAAAAEQRKLDRSTAAKASTFLAPAEKQRTLVVCRGADLVERTQVLEQGARSGTSNRSLQRRRGMPGQ